MKASELFQRIMSGELFLVGEYRGGQAVANSYVDKKTGLAITRILVSYIVECSLGGCFDFVKISANAPDGAKTAEEVVIPLQRGQRYAFPVQSVSRERDLATAWLGKAEPLAIEAD